MLTRTKRYINLESIRTVKPREFCKRWFNATDDDEQVRGYRAKCVNLLSRILGVKPETISSKWGEGIEFEQMPETYQKTLAYANSLREIVDAAGNNPDLADLVIERMKSR